MSFFRSLALCLAFLVMASLFLQAPALAEEIDSYRCRGMLNENQVVVYYFTRKFGCQSCRVVESALPETIERHYGPLLQNGRLALCVVNLDEPANQHFLEQFDLLANSVVIVQKKAGQVYRFKNLEAIWDISQDPDAISLFLQQEVASFLPGT